MSENADDAVAKFIRFMDSKHNFEIRPLKDGDIIVADDDYHYLQYLYKDDKAEEVSVDTSQANVFKVMSDIDKDMVKLFKLFECKREIEQLHKETKSLMAAPESIIYEGINNCAKRYADELCDYFGIFKEYSMFDDYLYGIEPEDTAVYYVRADNHNIITIRVDNNTLFDLYDIVMTEKFLIVEGTDGSKLGSELINDIDKAIVEDADLPKEERRFLTWNIPPHAGGSLTGDNLILTTEKDNKCRNKLACPHKVFTCGEDGPGNYSNQEETFIRTLHRVMGNDSETVRTLVEAQADKIMETIIENSRNIDMAIEAYAGYKGDDDAYLNMLEDRIKPLFKKSLRKLLESDAETAEASDGYITIITEMMGRNVLEYSVEIGAGAFNMDIAERIDVKTGEIYND